MDIKNNYYEKYDDINWLLIKSILNDYFLALATL